MDLKNAIVIVLGILAVMNSKGFAEEPTLIQMKGKSLFSFTQDHFIVQTEKYFYKISKEGLSAELVSKLEKSAIGNEDITVSIPSKKIDYIWPTVFLSNSCCWGGKSRSDYDMAATELQNEVTENKGKVHIKGILVLSFSEPYYLVQVKDSVYQIKKSTLSKEQIRKINKISLGSQLSVTVPKSAVDYSWSFKQDVARNIASVEEPDEMSVNKSYMTLKGTVLYSADEPTVIIQSKDVIYQLKRKGILTKNPELLDLLGSKVRLIVPINEIDFFWSAKSVKLIENGPK